ncbi:ankyrin [Ascobolus immersus RN42]|uniref:Ankyrin n=1 Tax=Ascobolus immersus RN42 TaxID=1160509 RepID=A0A3N4I7T8_ASCIM|nr:ankyrin [Ascobolus immersus RN42]
MADDNDLLQLVVHGPISTNTDIPFPRTDALCRAFLQPYEDIVLGSKVRDLVGKANRGRISMGLAVSHAVGFFSNRSSVEQTLRWLEKAAEFGHSPALAYGSRAFEAHGRPVPSVFTRKSTTAFPSAHYSDMLRESWHRHIIDVDQRPILAVLGITLESNSSHAALTETAINLVKTSPSLWLLEGTWNFHRIHFFCMFGCLEETEDLISRDADCANFLSEPLKETPLIIACKNGHAEVALCLLRTGKVDSTATDVFGYNAFHYLLSLPAGKWKEVAEGLLAAAGDSQSEEPPFLQNADRITYIEPLFAELCGTPIEWAAMSGNWEMVQFFADKTDLSGILRQRIVLIGLRLALPELLECGLKLAIEMETLQAATRHEWDLDSVFEMNLFGRIGLGYSGVGCEGLAWTSKAIVMSPGMERMATLFTAWIAHGSNTKSKYIQCIETLVRFGLSIKDDIRRNRIGGSSVLRAIQSNNAMLVDILLSKGFPFTKSRTQDDRSKWAFLDFDGAVEFSQAQIAISIYLGGHPRHEPKEILPIFETLHKHGVLVPKEDDDYDFLSAAVNSEFRVAGTGSLDFLVQYLLDHGYAEVQRRKGSWWRLLGDAHSTTTLRALLENGGREYINARSIDGDRMVQVHGCNQSPASSTKPCCHHKHDCGTALFKILVDNVFEEYCREFLNYGAHAHLRGFHSHSILHRIIDFREAHAKVAAPFTWMDSLLQQKQLQVILNQTDYLDATVLQYATVYGDKYMVQSLLGGGADPSHFTSVPEACVLVSHSLRYPPWFVIPGDSPAFQRTCLFPTRSSADYREALKEILKLLLKAGSMNKQCLCPLCSGKHNPLNRLALTREANPTTLPADATVHTVFPRFFHRNDLEFVLLREKVEGRLTFAEMLRNQSQ